MAAKEKILTKSPQVEPPSVSGERNAAPVLIQAAMGPFHVAAAEPSHSPNPGSGREPCADALGIWGPGRLGGSVATAQSLPAWR